MTPPLLPPLTNLALRRFFNQANRRYFGGKLCVNEIMFSNKLPGRWSGKFGTRIYEYPRGIASARKFVEVEVKHIHISARLRRSRDLCMMTLYHEMVHAELDRLGFWNKDNSCSKRGIRFNRRMTELARAGAFNGLW